MYSTYLSALIRERFSVLSLSSCPVLTCSFLLSFFLLQTPSQLLNPGTMTMSTERRSSPRWPVAWFLSLRSPWRKVVKRNRGREGRMTPLPLPAPTLTCWHDAFSILGCTAPSGSSSRISMPPHPPKYRGTMCSSAHWESLFGRFDVHDGTTTYHLWSEIRNLWIMWSFLQLSHTGGGGWLWLS